MFNSDLVIDYLIMGENALKEMESHEDFFAKLFLFLRAMQTAIDTSFILIVNLNLKKPKNYFEIFTILREGRIISVKTEEEMLIFAALRSKLIFNTNESELSETLSLLSDFKKTFLNFISEVRQFINNMELINIL